MWDLKNNDTNELIYQTETDLENEFIVTGGQARGEIDWEFGNAMYTLLYVQ